MQQLQIDPEFKNLIQPLTPEEFKQLEENIFDEGCREPIITWNGIIIDGHNRYEICQKWNIPFKTIAKGFSDKLDVKIWIVKNQLGRRNLEIYQKGKLALQMESLFQEKAKKNKQLAMEEARKNNPKNKDELFLTNLSKTDNKEEIEPMNTRKELAKLAGVSEGTLSKIKVIEKAAEKGNEVAIEVEQKLQEGKIKLNEAYNDLKEKTDLIKPRPRIKEEIIEEEPKVQALPDKQEVKKEDPIMVIPITTVKENETKSSFNISSFILTINRFVSDINPLSFMHDRYLEIANKDKQELLHWITMAKEELDQVEKQIKKYMED